MNEQFVFQSIVSTVPHWFESNNAGQDPSTAIYSFTVGNNEFYFRSHNNLTPKLAVLHDFCIEHSEAWLNELPSRQSIFAKKKNSQQMVMCWLNQHDNSIDWEKFILYGEELLMRTYENLPVCLNLVISTSNTGHQDLSIPAIQKVIDPLATSMQTYLKVDPAVRLVSYEEINWADVRDTSEYKFNPEFLQPISSILQDGEFSFHVTSKGDIIIMNKHGLLASCRKGRWHIYDVCTFKNSIVAIMNENFDPPLNEYRIGCNLFDIMLDLSYKRHGALLIYDPHHTVINHVVNAGSTMNGHEDMDESRKILMPSVYSIQMKDCCLANRKKRVLLELASMDGAIIFDANNILSFGSMIETHSEVGNHAGARTTAFESALRYGGIPIKISSDGDISIRFNTESGILNFL